MAAITASLKSGAEYLGQLAHRGAFDQYGRYSPGEVVTDDGVTYVNVVPVGAGPVRWDDFSRTDRVGWGAASSGDAWQSSEAWAYQRPPVLRGGEGVLSGDAESLTNAQLLGPSASLGDVELLARVRLSDPGAGHTNALQVLLSTTEDAGNLQTVYVTLNTDGTTTLHAQGLVSGETLYEHSETLTDLLLGDQPAWVRVRRVGNVLTARVWLEGTAEPSAAQATLDTVDAQPAGHPGLHMNPGDAAVECAISYIGVRQLSSATAPGSDSAHWAPVATALSLPQPQ